jgi:hypothetical protein
VTAERSAEFVIVVERLKTSGSGLAATVQTGLLQRHRRSFHPIPHRMVA